MSKSQIATGGIADNAVLTGKITDGTIATGDIADGAVTFGKVDATSTEANNIKQRLCKVWVNFNGSGTVAIRDDFNVSSITDSSTGEYLVNFSTALANNDNAMFVSAGKAGGAPSSSNSSIAFLAEDSSQTTGRIDMKVTDSTGSTVDRDLVTAIAFGESA
tara:strand:- start:43 stop:525 length:483 start_codon:yes stop_codon:yes gene_type:complete